MNLAARLAEIEDRLVALQANIAEVQGSLRGTGQIINYGKSLGIDLSGRLSDLLKNATNLPSASVNDAGGSVISRHAINSSVWHQGLSGATADNIVSFDSKGLPKDCGVEAPETISAEDVSGWQRFAKGSATIPNSGMWLVRWETTDGASQGSAVVQAISVNGSTPELVVHGHDNT